ncbi:unnamed protein product [Amoebophrya sp. A120]|nr:unnamed protein product [Amoebophrya sp. A120]|eukprot:GSA120T00002206001.1
MFGRSIRILGGCAVVQDGAVGRKTAQKRQHMDTIDDQKGPHTTVHFEEHSEASTMRDGHVDTSESHMTHDRQDEKSRTDQDAAQASASGADGEPAEVACAKQVQALQSQIQGAVVECTVNFVAGGQETFVGVDVHGKMCTASLATFVKCEEHKHVTNK